MKLKSLLAIMSCTLIHASISIPSIAKAAQKSYVQTESINIRNKDYRNKQSTLSMIGSWKSGVEDNEYRHTEPQEIYFDMASDGTTTFAFRKTGQPSGFATRDYRLASTKDPSISVLKRINNNGEITSVSAIKWISHNEFIVLILKEPAQPHREGIQRRFVRIQEPVATQLQQQAQVAVSRQKLDRLRKLEESRGRFNGAINNTGAVQRIYNSPYSSPF